MTHPDVCPAPNTWHCVVQTGPGLTRFFTLSPCGILGWSSSRSCSSLSLPHKCYYSTPPGASEEAGEMPLPVFYWVSDRWEGTPFAEWGDIILGVEAIFFRSTQPFMRASRHPGICGSDHVHTVPSLCFDPLHFVAAYISELCLQKRGKTDICDWIIYISGWKVTLWFFCLLKILQNFC